jgi:hypothetical protein
MFESIDKYARTEFATAALDDVTVTNGDSAQVGPYGELLLDSRDVEVPVADLQRADSGQLGQVCIQR